MRPGDEVRVTALYADGVAYRWWRAIVESVDDGRVVVVRPVGWPVHEPGHERVPTTTWRNVFWTDRSYNVTEGYAATGEPIHVCVDVASPARIEEGAISYVDYELDIVKQVGAPAEVFDEDEFEEAIGLYGYSTEHQAVCRRSLEEGPQVAESWDLLERFRGAGER